VHATLELGQQCIQLLFPVGKPLSSNNSMALLNELHEPPCNTLWELLIPLSIAKYIPRILCKVFLCVTRVVDHLGSTFCSWIGAQLVEDQAILVTDKQLEVRH